MSRDELAHLRRARDPIDRDCAQPLDVPAIARALRIERLRAGGAEVLQATTRQGYGVIDCAFRDPSGNTIRSSETVAV